MNASPSERADSRSILVVEGHELLRFSVVSWLRWRFPESRIQAVESGERALMLVREGSPDIVLMDIDLPGMNGIETTRRIKAQSPGTAVVILTMHDTSHQRVAATRAGAADYVLKHQMDQELHAIVQRLLARRASGMGRP